MENKDYTNDLKEIRNLMSRSSQFISLSGLSGILAGIYAIVGAFIAKVLYFPNKSAYSNLAIDGPYFPYIVGILLLVAIASILTAITLSKKRSKANKEEIWGDTSKRLVKAFLIPFLTGGIYIIIQLNNQHPGLTAAMMLIFYGLALVNASKFTVGTVRYLGIAEIVTGLLCAALPDFGFWFWVFGFGILHIIYGGMIYRQEKTQRS